jgi:hypothetical protein
MVEESRRRRFAWDGVFIARRILTRFDCRCCLRLKPDRHEFHALKQIGLQVLPGDSNERWISGRHGFVHPTSASKARKEATS